MFKYTKEIILNSLKMNDGKARVVSTDEGVVIKRAGEYKLENIVDGKIYKTEPKAGQLATLKFKGLEKDKMYRLSFAVKMIHKFTGDMANANFNEFGKEYLAEVKYVNGRGLAKAFELIKNPEVFSVDEVGKITFNDPYMSVSGVEVSMYDEATGEYSLVGVNDEVAYIGENVEPFGTGEWIRENLRFPSYPNMRYAPMYEDEQPIEGANYVQYAFAYHSERPGLGGLSGVGQKIEAVTQHIFYVREELASEFEAGFGGVTFDNGEVSEDTSAEDGPIVETPAVDDPTE